MFASVASCFGVVFARSIRTRCERTQKGGHLSQKILIVVGDGGESYETWFARHRFEEAGYDVVVAAPSRRRLNLVMHDFEPGWDT